MTTKWYTLFAALIMGAFLFTGCDENVDPDPGDDDVADDDDTTDTSFYEVSVYTNVDDLFTLTAFADEDVIGNTPTTTELEEGTYVFGAEHDNVLCLDAQKSVNDDRSVDLFCGLAPEGHYESYEDEECTQSTGYEYDIYTEDDGQHIELNDLIGKLYIIGDVIINDDEYEQYLANEKDDNELLGIHGWISSDLTVIYITSPSESTYLCLVN